MHILNVVADLAIFAGYLLVPLTWLRYLPLTRSVLVAGVLFFLSAAVTRLTILTGTVNAPWMTAVHLVQAIAVVWFVLGFWRLLMRADEIRHKAEARYHAQRIATEATETVDVHDEEAR